jgi:hypothetical protein
MNVYFWNKSFLFHDFFVCFFTARQHITGHIVPNAIIGFKYDVVIINWDDLNMRNIKQFQWYWDQDNSHFTILSCNYANESFSELFKLLSLVAIQMIILKCVPQIKLKFTDNSIVSLFSRNKFTFISLFMFTEAFSGCMFLKFV